MQGRCRLNPAPSAADRGLESAAIVDFQRSDHTALAWPLGCGGNPDGESQPLGGESGGIA